MKKALACAMLDLHGVTTFTRPSAQALDILGEAKYEFPKSRGTMLGFPIIRIIVFCGLYWGTPILGNYQI